MAASSIIGALRVNLGLDSAQFSNGLKRSKDQLGGFQKEILAIGAKIGGALAAAFSVRAMGQAADAWSDMSSRVGVAVGNMQAAPEIMERIHKIAQMTYSPLQQTADGFAENNAALKGLGYSTDQALDYTEALNNALVVSGAKGERAASVARALSVALATGKLSGDGLNSVLSNGGEIAELLAKELGTSRNGLIKMAQQGKITGDVIVKSLLGNMDALRDKAADMPATIADGFQKIGNSFTGLVGRMDQATGVSGAFAEVLGKISEGMDQVADFLVANADSIVTALNTMLATGAVVAAYFAGQFAIGFVGGVATALRAAWTQTVALNLALGAGSLGAARMGAATKLLQGALIGLRGALISTGIGALVVGAGYLITKLVDIVRATGGIGNAFKLMGEVISGVWEGVKTSAGSIPLALQGVWESVKADFFSLMGSLLSAWSKFMYALSSAASVAGLDSLAASLWEGMNSAMSSAAVWEDAAEEASATAAAKFKEAGNAITDGFSAAGDALAKLNVTVDESTDALGGDGGGLGGALDDTGSKAGGAGKKLSKFQEVMKALREEAERLKATVNMTDLQAAIWGKQKEAGVSAESAQGQQIASLMAQIDGMEKLKDASEKGRDAMKGFFGSFLEGADAARNALGNLLKEMAQVQFAKGMLGLIGGSGFMATIGNLLSFDGGGYTWDGPRSGGLDGRGGRLALLHPNETVFDHTRGQGVGGSIGMTASQMTLTDDGKIMATVRAEMSSGFADANRSLPARVQAINAKPRVR